jgi:RNA polymerase sigma-70 factor (ECF subfamily)
LLNTVVVHHDDLARLDDEVLAARASSDLDAFAELYKRYRSRIYRFMRSNTADPATAEDLTAYAFFRALSFASTFRRDGTYKAWIFRIAQNTLASWRTGRERSDISVAEVPEGIDPSPSPISLTIADEARGLVWNSVSELPPAQREVVRLRYLMDLTVEEIARATRRSAGAVRVLLHRGRRSLRATLQKKGLRH